MKNISFALLLAGIFFSSKIEAQTCPCFTMIVTQDASNLCRFEISLTRLPGDSCGSPGLINEVALSLTDTSSQITSATEADTNIVANLNGDQTQAIFTTEFDLYALPADVTISIGSVLMATPAPPVQFETRIGGPGGTICTFGGYSFPVPCTVQPPTTFYKLYGNPADDNCPTKIKGFNNHTYVLSSRKTATSVFAVFSKFTNGGSLVWEKELNVASQLLDFEYTGPTDNSFLLVGRMEPLAAGGMALDNKSLLVKIDNFGTLVFLKCYEHTGRESFTRIIRHTAALPVGTPYQFYVLGHKNPTTPPGPPSNTDQPMLYNIDNAGGERFKMEYNYSVNGGPLLELEAHLGMFQLASGNVVILGDAAPNNDGILVEINGVTGAAVVGFGHAYNNANNTAQYDFWDGLELTPGGDIAIAGTEFNTGKAILLKVNSSFAPVLGKVFDNISEFHEIGKDPQGRLYVVGPAKVPPGTLDFPVLSRIVTSTLLVNYSAYYERGEQDWQNPHFSVTPNAQRIFYADARKVCGSSQFDMLVGAFTLNFAIQNPVHNCRKIFTQSVSPLTIMRTIGDVTAVVLTRTITPISNISDVVLACNPFCPASTCAATFTWQTGTCRDVQFTSTVSNNACPAATVTYAWTTGAGGNPATSSLPNPFVTYSSPGTKVVCLTYTVTQASIGYNCSVTVCQNVIVPAAALPTCTAPANISVNTNPGVCYAALSPQIVGTGCPALSISATANNNNSVGSWSGGSPLTLTGNYQKGITTVNATVTDGLNQTATCSFTVTVIDAQPPTIVCPQNISMTVPACNAGAIVNYPAPTVTDNCPMPTYNCSPPSGSFFPCGTTTVSCTATDMSQNMSQPCTFTVTINCQCASIGTTTIACDPVVDDKYLVTIPVTILNGSNNCTASVAGTGQSNVTVMINPITITSGSGTLTGMITVTGGVIPPTFNLVVTVNCVCPNGQPIVCTFPVTLVPICCKHIYLNNQSACATDQSVSVPIIGCSQFQCLQRLDYWVATGPVCPPFPGTGWTLEQSGTACAPLTLPPNLYVDNIWVKAIAYVCDFPCNIVESNIICITLCQPVSCNVSPPLQEFCYQGSCVPVGLLTANPVNLSAGCTVTSITWAGPGVPSGTTGPTYQPGALCPSPNLPPDWCYEDFVFTATVTTICGSQTCTAVVRLYNEDAPPGMLQMNPVELQPFCPGEDATLEFLGDCTSHPPAAGMWSWCFSTVGQNGPFSPLVNSGNSNPLWNTNQLYQDIWYQVKSQNGPVGACPPDEVVFAIDVCPPMTISNFIAALQAPPPACEATGVNLSVDFAPSPPCRPNCQIKVKWMKNGQMLHMGLYTSSPATWSYVDLNLLGDYSGTYYAIVEGCCGEILTTSVVVIDPPCFAKLAVLNAQGLNVCYRCNNEPITLCGLLFNVPSSVTCTYQWFANSVPITGATTPCITVYQANVLYTFQATCGGCVKEASYYLPQCGSGPFLFTFFRDFDSDDFGNVDSTLADDEVPPGYVPDSTDCNDMNPAIHPGAPEICNSLDDDCNGNPEAVTTTWTGNGDNLNWSDAANWSDGIVPLTCQDVVIPASKIVKVAAGFNAVGKTLIVPQTAQLTVETTGTLTIQN